MVQVVKSQSSDKSQTAQIAQSVFIDATTLVGSIAHSGQSNLNGSTATYLDWLK